MRTTTVLLGWKRVRHKTYVKFSGTTEQGNGISLYTQIDYIDRGAYYSVRWSEENSLHLYKKDERL